MAMQHLTFESEDEGNFKASVRQSYIYVRWEFVGYFNTKLADSDSRCAGYITLGNTHCIVRFKRALETLSKHSDLGKGVTFTTTHLTAVHQVHGLPIDLKVSSITEFSKYHNKDFHIAIGPRARQWFLDEVIPLHSQLREEFERAAVARAKAMGPRGVGALRKIQKRIEQQAQAEVDDEVGEEGDDD